MSAAGFFRGDPPSLRQPSQHTFPLAFHAFTGERQWGNHHLGGLVQHGGSPPHLSNKDILDLYFVLGEAKLLPACPHVPGKLSP